MTTRNVDLLIRARDGASKAFKDVSRALDELLGVQEGVAASGARLDKSLSGSAVAAAGLAQKLGPQTAGEVRKAEATFKRIEATVDQNTAALDRMGRELSESEARYDALKREAKAAEEAIVSAALAARRSGADGDTARLEAAQRAYRDLNREIARSGTSLEAQASQFRASQVELEKIVNVARTATFALNEVRQESARAQGRTSAGVATAQANENAARGIAKLAEAEARVAREIADRERETREAAETYQRGIANAAQGMAGLAQAERRVAAEVRARAAAQANANASKGFGGLALAEQSVAQAVKNSAAASAAADRAYAQLNARLEQMRAASRPTAAEQAKLADGFRRALSAGRAYQPTLRQIVRELAGLGPASASAANGVRRVSSEMFNARRAFAAFYGDSRKALSLMQRLRGEVLSLTASFVGFYGIFQTGRGFLESFQSLEAAQNRLGAAFNQDYGAVNAELERLQAEAGRLGISFDVLSDNFSKFVLSGQQAGLEVDKIRTIFRQVSESGRVLKLSNEQIEGTFNALIQIAGKGTLQMEELRQQLGDRLPGAVGIVAKALGYGEDRLADFYKAVEDGQIGAEEALVALGNGLEETYGAQLADALDSVTAKIGQLQNLFLQRQLTAAKSGFIEGLEEALDALNAFLDSREGIEFFESLGAAFGRLVKVLPVLLENLDLIVGAFKAFVAIKVGQVVSGFAANLSSLGKITFANRRVQVALNAAIYAFSPAAASAMASSTRLGAALRGLRAVAAGAVVTIRAAVASLGGVVGIAAAAISFFAFDALTGADETAQALNQTLEQHKSIIGEVRSAYLEAAGDANKWQKALEDITEVELQAHLSRLRDELAAFRKENPFAIGGNKGDAPEARTRLLDQARTPEEREQVERLLAAAKAFDDGTISASKYLETIKSVAEAAPKMFPPGLYEMFIQVAKGGKEIEDSIAEAEAAIRVFNGTATDADRELLDLTDATDESAKGFEKNAEAAAKFEEKLNELKEKVPGLADELKRVKEQKAITDLLGEVTQLALQAEGVADAWERFAEALKSADATASASGLSGFLSSLGSAAGKILEAVGAAGQALQAADVNAVSGYTGNSGADVAAQFLRDREGFRATPYNDPRTDANGNQIGPDIYRAGYGSDTVTLSDGTIQRVTQGMRVSVEDANRDLLRRITTEFQPIAERAAGSERFATFTPQQQAALISIAYNYGEIPDRIAEAVRSGTDEQIANAIRGLGGDNGGANRDRRNLEAALFTTDVGQDDLIAADERRLELAEDFNEKLRQRIADADFELSLEGKRLQDAEVAKALREAELEAQKAGVKLTAEQRAEIERVTRAQFASAQAEEDRNKALEKAKALEEEVALLQERRRFLTEQQTQQEGQGDLVGAARTQEELAGVEAQLDSAIQKALQFWEALGGEGSERAIMGLKLTQQELQKVESRAIFTGEQINSMIADGLTGAISTFSQAVANGENAWAAFRAAALKALSDVLIQIGTAIIRAALLNALTGGKGANAGVGGFVAGLVNSVVAHGGGVAGGAGPSRRLVNPAIFANAIRYHSGGIAGLAPDEVPAILKRNEEVLTESDPRHRFNGGGDGDKGLTIINTFDADDVTERALSGQRGRRALVNAVRGMKTEIKAVLG